MCAARLSSVKFSMGKHTFDNWNQLIHITRARNIEQSKTRLNGECELLLSREKTPECRLPLANTWFAQTPFSVMLQTNTSYKCCCCVFAANMFAINIWWSFVRCCAVLCFFFLNNFVFLNGEYFSKSVKPTIRKCSMVHELITWNFPKVFG